MKAIAKSQLLAALMSIIVLPGHGPSGHAQAQDSAPGEKLTLVSSPAMDSEAGVLESQSDTWSVSGGADLRLDGFVLPVIPAWPESYAQGTGPATTRPAEQPTGIQPSYLLHSWLAWNDKGQDVLGQGDFSDGSPLNRGITLTGHDGPTYVDPRPQRRYSQDDDLHAFKSSFATEPAFAYTLAGNWAIGVASANSIAIGAHWMLGTNLELQACYSMGLSAAATDPADRQPVPTLNDDRTPERALGIGLGWKF